MSKPTTLEEMIKMVEIPGKNYSIGKYQVTQALWESVMGNNPSDGKGSSRPVENVSWFDCIDLCNKLSRLKGLRKTYTIKGELPKTKYDENPTVQCNFKANGYRLPTDWEWYFAAKANQNFKYAGSDNPGKVAWYWSNSDGVTHGVGQKKANGFGLFDMSGNVWEWCWDWFKGDFEDIPKQGSTGPSKGAFRVLRGGSWDLEVRYSRVSYRNRYSPEYRLNHRGFRLCRTI